MTKFINSFTQLSQKKYEWEQNQDQYYVQTKNSETPHYCQNPTKNPKQLKTTFVVVVLLSVRKNPTATTTTTTIFIIIKAWQGKYRDGTRLATTR
jgi:hypothetical protein